MRCILCPMNTVSLSFFRSSQQFQCSRQSASAEPQCGFYKKWTCRLFIMFLIWKSWVSQWRELFLFQCQCHAPESKSKHLQIVKFVWFNCRSGHFLLYGKGSLLSTRMTINWPCSKKGFIEQKNHFDHGSTPDAKEYSSSLFIVLKILKDITLVHIWYLFLFINFILSKEKQQ